jgi:hypothetical protein
MARAAEEVVERSVESHGEVPLASGKQPYHIVRNLSSGITGSAPKRDGTRSDATVDALVVAHAVAAGGGLVLTADAKDFRPLSELHPEVRIQPL